MSSAIVQVDCPKCKHEILVAIKIQKRPRKLNAEKKDSTFHQYADWAFRSLYGTDPNDSAAVGAMYQRWGRTIKQILAFAKGSFQTAQGGTKSIGRWAERNHLDWTLETVAKRFPDWMQDQRRFE